MGIAVKTVISKRASLSEAKCIYGSQVIDVLQHPRKYVFKDLLVTDLDNTFTLQSVHKNDSSSEIIDIDVNIDDLTRLRPEVECDLGVLRESVKQLKSHDVIAINTH